MAEVCFVNGVSYYAPTERACFVAGGDPVSDTVQDGSSAHGTLPFSSTPLQFEPNPEWINAIEEYSRAVNDFEVKNDDLVRAKESLENLATDLFKLAFLVDQPKIQDIQNWYAFLSLVDQASGANELVSCYANLSHPKILPEDRTLLFQLINSEAESQGQLVLELQGKVAAYWKEAREGYNGWQGGYYTSPPSAYLSALESCFGTEEYERFVGATLYSKLRDVLTVITPREAEGFLNMSEKDLIFEMDRANMEVEQFPVGTEHKIRAAKHLGDLETIALARGISLEAYHFDRFLVGVTPGLKEEDYQMLYSLDKVAASIENTDNNRHRADYLKYFEQISGRFLQAAYNSEERIALARALSILYGMAADFGLPLRVLDMLLEFQSQRSGVPLEVEDYVVDMPDLEMKGPVTIGPRGLPREVGEILAETGYDELVMQNIREIVFTAEINEGYDLSGNDAGGNALSSTRMVQIDVIDPEGKILPAWEIAMILVHEAAHVVWAREITSEVLLQPVFDERQAFLTGAEFLESYLLRSVLEGAIDSGAEEAKRIALQIVHARTAAKAANYVLGYDEDNMDPWYQELPSAELLKSRSLSRPLELDLSGYPPQLSAILAEQRLDELMEQLNLGPYELGEVKDLFWNILYGGLVITERSSEADIGLTKTAFTALYEKYGIAQPQFPDQFYISSLEILNELTNLMIVAEASKFFTGSSGFDLLLLQAY